MLLKINNYYMFYIVPTLIFIDFITKYLTNLYLNNQINIFWELIYLKHVKNPWIAFGINLPFLKIITIILIVWIIFYYIRYEKLKNNKLINLSFSLIIWWALWNAWERVLYWNVTDMLWIKYFSVFNFADIFLTIWVALYLLLILLKKD